MSEPRSRITRLSNASISGDGKFFKFDIETEDNDPAPVEIALDDIGMLVTYIATGAARGCEMLGIEAKPVDEAETPIEGIPLRGIGFAQSDDRRSFQLVLRLPGFWMPFEVESTQMAEVADTMATIARLLSATGKPQ